MMVHEGEAGARASLSALCTAACGHASMGASAASMGASAHRCNAPAAARAGGTRGLRATLHVRAFESYSDPTLVFSGLCATFITCRSRALLLNRRHSWPPR